MIYYYHDVLEALLVTMDHERGRCMDDDPDRKAFTRTFKKSLKAVKTSRPETSLTPKVIETLSPGIRALVVWLNKQGFKTCDSGDGSNFKGGMECAVEFPMVVIKANGHTLKRECLLLYDMLMSRGVDFTPRENGPEIQATFNPADGESIIMLMNVLSRDIGL